MGSASCHAEGTSVTTKPQRPVPTARSAEVLAAGLNPSVARQRTLGAPAPAVKPADILALQRLVGNQAVQRMLDRRPDEEPTAALADDFGPRDGNGVAAGADVAVERAGASSGQGLPSEVRSRFEGSLGADLSGVRVHTGRESAEAATAVGAKAYTVGQDIHFSAGNYKPTDSAGVQLLAHEVVHTVQNQGAGAAQLSKLEVSTPADAAEIEADQIAAAMVAPTPTAIHRDDLSSEARVGRIPTSSTP